MKYLKHSGLLLCILLWFNISLLAQVPQVENHIQFAGMELQLTEQARRDIQSSVDALYRSEKHFNLMLEKVDLYMPVVESIFEEYEIPEEFKYLVIQESALVPDAVSSSNAVGFWQFKEASAVELGLRVDREVDERMNIVSATEGAAKYLLRSNAEFDNWVYSLQSYMVGQGGTSRSVDKSFYGARKMKIDGDTHWYIKKFLSHLIAFENAIGKQSRSVVLYQYTNTPNKTLRDIALEFNTDEEQLLAYNKWLKASRIPDDKAYTVIIPVNVSQSEDLLATRNIKEQKSTHKETHDNQAFGQKQQRPELPRTIPDKLIIVEMNDLKGVVARAEDNIRTLAELGNMSEIRFRNFNDLAPGDKIKPGQFYYLEKKRRKARVYEHVVQPNESLWEIAQRYGLRLDKLKQKNRLSAHEQLKPGRVLWLRFIRPPYEEIEYRPVQAPKADQLYTSTNQQPTPAASTPVPVQEPTEQAKVQPEISLESKNNVEESNKPAPTLQESRPETGSKSLLFPADTPVNRDTVRVQKPLVQQEAEQPKDVQKDSVNSQHSPRKIPTENKQNSDNTNPQLYPDSEEAADSFETESTVKFIEEEPEKPLNNTPRSHTVLQGETLYAISRKYGVSVQDLIQWNSLPAQPILSIGQELLLSAPQKTTGQESTNSKTTTEATKAQNTPDQNDKSESGKKYHVVAAGESMYRVARLYNVTISDIMHWNNKENFDIKEGERLIVGESEE